MQVLTSRICCALIFCVIISTALAGPSKSSGNRSRKGPKSLPSENTISPNPADNSVTPSESADQENGTISQIMSGFSSESMQKILSQVITASSAVEHLEKMKNKLLSQFRNKTDEFATARGGYGGYGAYGFPSLEGALLSIAFLTFAVFLIDLIQQLLSRFRTGTAGIVPLVGRRKRNIFPGDVGDHLSSLTSDVLQSIERPTFGVAQ